HTSSSELMACHTLGCSPRAASGAGAKKAATTSSPQITVRRMGISRFTGSAEEALVDAGPRRPGGAGGRGGAQPRAHDEERDGRDLDHVARADGADEAGLAREVRRHGGGLLAHDGVGAGGDE